MKHATIALLMGASAIWAPAAHAEDYTQPHTLDGVTITGSRTVPTEKLTAVLQERRGTRVTQADMLADRDAIMKVLEQANVGGSVGVRIAPKSNHHINVEFTVQDQGPSAPAVTKIANRLHGETFTGNKSVATDKLEAASGLHAGDEVTNEKISAAQASLVAAYKAAKIQGVDVSIAGDISQDKTTGQVSIIWRVTETKSKQKKKSLQEQEHDDQVQ